jgi:hypothetical protein
MKRSNNPHPPLPVHDYGPALQSAVSWLGDRYLLASSIVARKHSRRPNLKLTGAPLRRLDSRR